MPSFDCKENPITFTTPPNEQSAIDPFSNWQKSFPVRMAIATSDNDGLTGQIKLFCNIDPHAVDPQDIPSGYISCNGDVVDSDQYELLDDVLSFNPNYNGFLPDCEDKVIIRYSDKNNIPFGSIGGNDKLPEFRVEHGHDLIINHDEEKCHFGMFYIVYSLQS